MLKPDVRSHEGISMYDGLLCFPKARMLMQNHGKE